MEKPIASGDRFAPEAWLPYPEAPSGRQRRALGAAELSGVRAESAKRALYRHLTPFVG